MKMKKHNNYTEWFSKNFHRLSNYGMWFRGLEPNAVPSSEIINRNYSILICRLSTYSDTLSSFTHRLLYQMAASNENIFPDFSYLPPYNDLKIFIEDNIPLMIGCISKSPANNFDMIAVSNSIIQELVNLPIMLKSCNIPLLKKERLEDESIPLIILGGANAPNSMVIWNELSPVDGIYIGDDSESIKNIFNKAALLKNQGKTKKEILLELESVTGFFQPENPIKIKENCSTAIYQPDNIPQPVDTGMSDTSFLQLSHGCPYFCSFCAESWQRKPYTESDLNSLITSAMEQKKNSASTNVELYSFNFNIYNSFYELIWALSDIYPQIGLKSQRFDQLSRDPDLLPALQVLGKNSFTCGLEGISTRLRSYLQKDLSYDQLQKSLTLLFKTQIRELKIFLIATGLETDNDYNEFKNLLAFIKDLAQGKKFRIIFSMTPLVRFPGTPLGLEDAPEPSIYQKIIKETRRIIEYYGFELRTAADVDDYLMSQILVRADNPLIWKSLLDAAIENNFLYYRDFNSKFIEDFKNNLNTNNLDTEQLLKYSKPAFATVSAVSENFVKQYNQSCKNFTDETNCWGTNRNEGKCSDCGACSTVEQKKFITSRKLVKKINHLNLADKIKKNKTDLIEIAIKVSLPNNVSGIARKSVASVIASALMKYDNRLTKGYAGFTRSLHDEYEELSWINGDDILHFKWKESDCRIIHEHLDDQNIIEKINNFIPEGWGEILSINNTTPEKYFLEITSPYEFNGQEFFNQNHLKYNLRKISENNYSYDLTKESLKKKEILELVSSKISDTEHHIKMVCGPRFNYRNILEKGFKITKKESWAHIKVKINF